MLIGEQIRKLREEKGLTQAQLAEGHTTPSYVSYIERTNSLPSRRILKILADRLGVPLGYFEGAQIRDEHPTLLIHLERMRAHIDLGNLDKAEAMAREALAEGIDEHDSGLRGRFALALGLLRNRSGRSEEALTELHRGLELATLASDWPAQVETAMWLGVVHRQRGEIDLAIRHGRTADGLSAESGEIDPDLRHRVSLELAITLQFAGDHEGAATIYARIKDHESEASPFARANMLLGLCEVSLAGGNLQQALSHANAARQIARDENERNLTARAEMLFAETLLRQHKYTDALPFVQRSLSRWESQPGYDQETARLHLLRARIEASLQRFKEAEDYVQRALKLDYRLRAGEPSPIKAEAFYVRGQIQREERYLSEAQGSFENASRVYQQCEMYLPAADCLKQAAAIMIRLDEPIRAYNTLSHALELTRRYYAFGGSS